MSDQPGVPYDSPPVHSNATVLHDVITHEGNNIFNLGISELHTPDDFLDWPKLTETVAGLTESPQDDFEDTIETHMASSLAANFQEQTAFFSWRDFQSEENSFQQTIAEADQTFLRPCYTEAKKIR